MDMIEATTFEGNIDNNSWSEIIFAITKIKNVKSSHALEEDSFY